MAQGIVTYRNGKMELTPDGAGGVFIKIVRLDAANTSSTVHQIYVPEAAGMEIFGVLVRGGYHNPTYRGQRTSNPYVEYIAYNTSGWNWTPPGGWYTDIAIFAR